MESNVVSLAPLGGQPRLSRSNALRSSCYEQKASFLSDEGRRRRLLIMEAKLYGESGGQAVKSELLPRPEGTFQCAEGKIWFCFSQSLRKYILTEFEFSFGGTGGLPVPALDGTPRLPSPRGLSGAELAEELAARLGRVCGSVVERLRGLDFAPVLSAFASGVNRPFLACTNWSLSGDHRKGNATLSQLVEAHRVLTAPDSTADTLPDWSVLGRFVAAREQLDNSYARSILTGEALCQIATRWSPISRSHNILANRERLALSRRVRHSADEFADSGLLAESHSIIRALHGDWNTCNERRSFQHYITVNLADDILLADDRILSLIRSEMTYNISAIISRRTALALDNLNVQGGGACDQIAHSKVIRKFYLLRNFVSLSEKLFGAAKIDLGSDAEISNFWSGLELPHRSLRAAISSLSSFDLVVNSIFANVEDVELLATSNEADSGYVRDRLLDLTSELLGPLQ